MSIDFLIIQRKKECEKREIVDEKMHFCEPADNVCPFKGETVLYKGKWKVRCLYYEQGRSS